MAGPRPLVIVGASLAGLRAAEAARKAGYDGPLVLVGAEPHLPYDRPPLSKAFLAAGPDPPAETTFRTEAQLAELGIELRLGAPATALDLEAREVELDAERLPYERLVVATGSSARQLPGERLDGVHTLRTVDDARAIRRGLDAGARTVVIGGGFIGSEIASAAHARGHAVTIVEAAQLPLVRAVGEQMAAACAALHERAGTELRCGAGVERIEGEGRVERVALADGTALEADLVVVGIGAEPVTGWLEDSGLRVQDGIVCDATLRAADGVYAAGDVARWENPLFGETMRLEHWTSAAEQGRTAARNAVDPEGAVPYASVPYFWSDWYERKLQMVGVTGADEVRVVGDLDDPGGWLALYRRDARLTGALGLDRMGVIMKYRAMIAKGASWDDALAFAAA